MSRPGSACGELVKRLKFGQESLRSARPSGIMIGVRAGLTRSYSHLLLRNTIHNIYNPVACESCTLFDLTPPPQ